MLLILECCSRFGVLLHHAPSEDNLQEEIVVCFKQVYGTKSCHQLAESPIVSSNNGQSHTCLEDSGLEYVDVPHHCPILQCSNVQNVGQMAT